MPEEGPARGPLIAVLRASSGEMDSSRQHFWWGFGVRRRTGVARDGSEILSVLKGDARRCDNSQDGPGGRNGVEGVTYANAHLPL